MTVKTCALALAAIALHSAAHAENVEVYATDMLDNIQSGYCLDISGGQGAQADPADGLQGHTCYSPSGEIFVDQAFDSDRFAEGVFYMPEFDVCMQATALEEGAALELAACDGSAAQSFAFSESDAGTISPASDSGLCVTLHEETRFGRSQENQIKALSLAACSEAAAGYQTWAFRTAG